MRLKIFLIAVALAAGFAVAQEPTLKPVARIADSEGLVMRSKLVHSQELLEGLLRNDFSAIERSADRMIQLSKTAEWPRPRDAVYEHYSAEFRRNAATLKELAQKRDHQAASFTYLHLTRLCIDCHNHVRDGVRVAGPAKRPAAVRIPTVWPE